MELDQTKYSGVDHHGRPILVPSVTVDAMVIRPKSEGSSEHEILLITRGFEPFKGRHAYPGGFVDYNEDPLHAVVRELEEECGIKGSNPTLVTVAGKPGRDPRKHVISIFYKIEVEAGCEIKAGDDAATAQFYDIKDMLKRKDDFAFDHFDQLKVYL